MRKIIRMTVPALGFAAVMALSGVAEAGCVSKGGRGTGPSRDSAVFQAWEAVLQATSWGSWAQFMTAGARIGSAPGYKVSNMRTSCKAGGALGQECVITARLCN